MRAYLYRMMALLMILMLAGCSPTAAADPTDAPITQEPTLIVEPTSAVTMTPVIVAQPTVVATISIDPTATHVLGASPTVPPTIPAATNQYVVQFIPANDTLNVRAGAGVQHEVVAELVNGDRVVATGEAQIVGADRWLPIESVAFPSITGWANARYLVADDPAVFCVDPRPTTIIEIVRTALQAGDSDVLADMVSPEHGLTVGGLNWSETVHLTHDQVRGFFDDTTTRSWGNDLYSDQAITGSIRDFIVPLMAENLVPPTIDILCHDSHDTLMGRGIYPGGGEGMESLPFYSVQRPGADGNELDWGAWAFGFVPIDQSSDLSGMKLVYLSYYTWTP